MKIALLILTLLVGNQLFGQTNEKHHRVKIILTNHTISEVSILGLETDHGKFYPGKYFVNDFSESELLLLREAEIPYRIEIEDVSNWYRTQAALHVKNSTASITSDCNNDSLIYHYTTPVNYQAGSMAGYFTYEEYLQNIDAMASKYPHLISTKAQISDILTHDDRPIYWLRMSDNPNVDEEEPEILYTAVHHAREVNSLSQLIFFMWYALENYETDPEIKFMLDETELYFIPMVNPDGYNLNQSNYPEGGGLWRKNAWRDDTNELKGVDLNRNYGYQWGYDDTGSSPDPDRQTFRGNALFSEPETQAVKLFCEAHDFFIALNYHSYGNLLIQPWGFISATTSESTMFNALGHALNSENEFVQGNSSQTLNYKANGYSDDWMYGETDTKNPIYSFTPEVGPSEYGFWPPATAADRLNKSAVRMNINAALLPHNLLIVTDKSPTIFNGPNQKLDLELTQYGLNPGTNIVSVASSNPAIQITGAAHVSNLNQREKESIEIPFTIDPNLINIEKVTFIITVDNEDFVSAQNVTKTVFPIPTQIIVDEPGSTIENFIGNGEWAITDEAFVSSPTSFTDSPGSNYTNNRKDYFMYQNAFDLSNSMQATLKFQARWNIENDFDFVQILVGTSSDFSSMIPQCGLYTNPASQDQHTEGQVYDGEQLRWVHESINLEDFLGEKEVYFAFSFESDEYIVEDGFYFDDLIVESLVDDMTSIDDVKLINEWVVIPNPTTDAFQIHLGAGLSSKTTLNFQVVDVTGKLIQFGSLKNTQTISLAENASGTYHVIVFDGDLKLGVKKVVKL